MKYKKYDMEGYNLYTTETDRFKTIGLKINIRIDDNKDNEKYAGLLWRMLVSTSYKYDKVKEINEACAKIYDPMYNIRAINSGNQLVFCMSASFANEKYTEEGMNDKSIKFLLDVIFKPRIIDDGFDEEVFEIKKAKFIDYLKSVKDYPREYSDYRIDEETDYYGYKIYKLSELIELIKKVTNKELYDFYKKVMSEGKLDIFVCGNFKSDDIRDIFKKYVKFTGDNRDRNHVVIQTKYHKKPRIIIDNSSNVQSNLIIGCKCLNISEYERNYVFLLYTWILGGWMNSLLNQTVREKNSLCYYIYSIRRSIVGIMKIYAGIDGKNFDETYSLIQKEMKNIEEGNFSLELFEGVKKIYYNSLISMMDSQNEMMENHIFEVYTRCEDTITRKKMMEKVSKEDIMKFAKKIHIDTVYLLKGDKK